MAKHQKDLAGWEYLLSDTNNNQNTPTRRSRRSTQSTSTITLKRTSDDLELQPGDTILISDQDSQTEIALVKSIDFGIDDFIEILVVWFQNADQGERNEVYITPYIDKIQVRDIIMKVNILSFDEYSDIVLDESNSSNTYMTRHGFYEDGKLTEVFDFRELMKKFKENPDEFVVKLRAMTGDPKKRRSTPVPKPRQTKSKPVESDSSGLEESEVKSTQYDSDEQEEEEEEEEEDDEYMDALESPIKRSPQKLPQKSPRKRASTPTPSPKKQTKQIEELYSTVLTPTKRRRIFKPATPKLPPLLSPTKTNPLTDPTSQAFQDIKAKLHTSQKLNSLPGREDEYAMIYMNLESAVNEETGCCVYISGVPGMGKTATIRDVIQQMQLSDEIKPFDYLEINGLKLITPNVAYEMLWECISGDKVSPANSALLLEEYFNREDKNRKPFIILMDELDQIATKKQNVMYNFMNWPTYKHSKLIVIAVANTMDLPERVLSNKISSRLGLRRIQFKGYTFDQLGDIIRHRLDMLSNKKKVSISSDAIGFASRKVASVSGDARRALTICRRAVEIAEREYTNEEETYQVKISHISQAINETVNSPLSQYLSTLPYVGKLFLVSVLLRSKRTGLGENNLGDIIDEIKNVQYRDSTMSDILGKDLRIPFFKYILNSFVETGIIIQQNIQSERQRLISLNVPEEEIISVFKKDKEISHLL